MSKKLNIGDKVRFLSDVGGGIVSGFQPGNIVLVEDEDGFQIPAPIDDVVAIDTNKYNFVKHESQARKPFPPVTQKGDEGAGRKSGKSSAEEKSAPLSGAEYLASKTVRHNDEDSSGEVDEQLEAKVTRLAMQVERLELKLQQQEALLQKQELRLTALENKAYRRKTYNH